MAKIKCCNIACKYNSAIITKNERGTYDNDVDDMGICNCKEDIELISYVCTECDYEDEGIECKNFIFKEGINS